MSWIPIASGVDIMLPNTLKVLTTVDIPSSSLLEIIIVPEDEQSVPITIMNTDTRAELDLDDSKISYDLVRTTNVALKEYNLNARYGLGGTIRWAIYDIRDLITIGASKVGRTFTYYMRGI